MVANSGVGSFPVPERSDPIDGPGAFVSLAARLDDLVVIPWASATARANAYAALNKTPVEGTLSFLRDTDTLQYYTGATWTPAIPDSYPRGIVRYASLQTVWPTNGTYIKDGVELMMDDIAVTCPIVQNRIYRITGWVGCIDGDSGTSLSSGGGQLRLRYVSSGNKPTTSNNQLNSGRFMTVQNASSQTQQGFVQRIWQATGTGTFSFGLGVASDNANGIRVLEYGRELVVEDLGQVK